MAIRFALLISRQGKVRLKKWYEPCEEREREHIVREVSRIVLSRQPRVCNFLDYKGHNLVYRRYASLYFCFCVERESNELEMIEQIHHFVECLDSYFGNVCELDLIFNFHKTYFIFEEIFTGGRITETSKRAALRSVHEQDEYAEDKRKVDRSAVDKMR